MSLRLAAAAVLAAALLVPAAQAGPIASRAALDALLGGQGTLEDFEAFAVAAGDAVFLDCAQITATATCNGRGPGLVRPGASYGSLVSMIWDGAGYFSAPSREILAYDSTSISITFDTPAQAAGLDMRSFAAVPVSATVDVFGADGTTLLASVDNITLASEGPPLFFGWQEEGGIGRIVVSQAYRWWSPQIDNVAFGAIVPTPEPASAALLALGLAGLAAHRRRTG